MLADKAKPATHWFHEENPLLSAIPQFETPADLLEHLSFSPLAGLDVGKLSIMDRLNLLNGEKTPLEPTSQSLRAATAWYGMLVMGLRVRNPLLPEARRRYWTVINSAANRDDKLPPAPTSGIAVQITKGPTGTAKTVTAKRFCALLGRQRIDHEQGKVLGWNRLPQLVYLYSDLSHDGSRGGFLIALLVHMDEALGTHYATELPKRYKTVERLAVATIARLIAHYTGIIFLDEGQLRNLMLSDQAELMQLFLLSLMNSGIPLVLIGNERAFDWIDYSQDLTRINTIPPEHFQPVGAIDHPDVEGDWDSLFHGIADFYVVDMPPTDIEACNEVLRRCSGGIARLGLILWTSAQREVLHRGGNVLCAADLQAAYESRAFDDLRPLSDGFAKRDPDLLLRFLDVDVDYYARAWGKPLTVSEPESAPSPKKQQTNTTRRKRSGPSLLKSEQTRKKNEELKRSDLRKKLSSDDIRREGLKDVLIDGLDEARARVASNKIG